VAAYADKVQIFGSQRPRLCLCQSGAQRVQHRIVDVWGHAECERKERCTHRDFTTSQGSSFDLNSKLPESSTMDDRHVIVGVWRDSDIQRIGYVLKLIMTRSTSTDSCHFYPPLTRPPKCHLFRSVVTVSSHLIPSLRAFPHYAGHPNTLGMHCRPSRSCYHRRGHNTVMSKCE